MNLLASVNFLLFLLLLVIPSAEASCRKPSIVIIMADDLGWNDVGFHNPARTNATPNIDQLASEGCVLNSSYMMKSCTPSRSSLMTGRYAFRMGFQHKSLNAKQNSSVPLDLRFFPQELQDDGYSTHYVGKWHLGFCKPEMTPTYRGFDTFYGMYNGAGDYYTHIAKKGYDMQDNKGKNLSVDTSASGIYSTELFTDKAVEVIKDHDVSKPLFLFLSYQAVHGPRQVPERYISQYCANLNGSDLFQTHCAMTAAMDEGIGKVMAALNDMGIADNLIVFFTSDNGGAHKHGSSNWPLRGSKTTEWEGGTRVVSILHSKQHLPKAPYTWEGMIHVVDWYPTLLSAAGIKAKTRKIDGIDNWSRIVENKPSNRMEFVYNLNEVDNNYALRFMNFKLVNFSAFKPDGWINPYPGQGIPEDAPKGQPQFQLFDLEKDPVERVNLILNKDYKKNVTKMKRKLLRYIEQIEPFGPIYKTGNAEKYLNGKWTSGWC